MTRIIHSLSICLFLFAMLLSSGMANASSSVSPCATTDGIPATADCTHFRSYLRQLVDRWGQYPSTTIPESTMMD